MQTIRPSKLLKNVLIADVAVCAATAVLQLAFGQVLAEQLALPFELLKGTGILLGIYAVLLALLLWRCQAMWKAVVWVIILGNLGWAAITLDLLVMGVLTPNQLGLGYLAVQSVTVLALAALEYAGLKTSRPLQTVNGTHAHP